MHVIISTLLCRYDIKDVNTLHHHISKDVEMPTMETHSGVPPTPTADGWMDGRMEWKTRGTDGVIWCKDVDVQTHRPLTSADTHKLLHTLCHEGIQSWMYVCNHQQRCRRGAEHTPTLSSTPTAEQMDGWMDVRRWSGYLDGR